MARNINVGYVTERFSGIWNDTTAYRILDCVNNDKQSSFIALKDVPVGTPLSNEEYWLKRTDFDGVAAAEAARVLEFETKIMQIDSDVDSAEEFKNQAEQAVVDVGAVGDTKITAINTAGNTQVSNVNTAGTTQVNAVNTAGTNKLNEINAAGAVLYSAQTLTDGQKTQSRTNIGAAAAADLTAHMDSLSSHANLFAAKHDLITAPASGDSLVNVTDSVGGWVKNLTVFGKSVQDGTPSPDTPIPISRVSGSLVRAGENMLPKFNSVTSGGIVYTVSSDGTVTLNGTSTGITSIEVVVPRLPNGTYTISANNPVALTPISTHYLQLKTNNSFTSPLVADFANINAQRTIIADDDNIITGMRIRIGAGIMLTNFIIKPQLELGSAATTYEPYTGSTYTVPDLQGISLGGTVHTVITSNPMLTSGVYNDGAQYYCGDSCDYAVLADGTYKKLVQTRVNHLIFDGDSSEVWGIYTPANPQEGYTVFTKTISPKGLSPSVARTLSNIAPFVSFNYASATSGLSHSFDSTGSTLFVKLPTTIASTVEELRTFLAATPMDLYYLLATPTVTLGDPIFIDAPSGVMNLYHTSAVQPHIDVAYPLDVKKYIDNNISTLTAAIAELSAT